MMMFMKWKYVETIWGYDQIYVVLTLEETFIRQSKI